MRSRKEIDDKISEQAFWERLEVLAATCRVELTQMEVSMFDGLFAKKIGYSKAAAVVGEVLVQRRAVDPMPTVGDLLRRAGAQGMQTAESRAELASNDILAAVGEKGWTWPQKTENFDEELRGRVGLLGAEVVRRLGGWQKVCEAEGPPSVLRAQYMRLARAIIESGFELKLNGGAEAIEAAPNLDQLEGTL